MKDKYTKTKEDYSLAKEKRIEEIEIERERKKQVFVIPYGLEDIIKPLVGYILHKTNKVIDQKARGEQVKFKEPEVD